MTRVILLNEVNKAVL